MKWSEICVHTTNEAIEAISNILNENGASGVVIEDISDFLKERPDQFGEIYQLDRDDYPEEGVLIKSYLPQNDVLDKTVEQIKQAINRLIDFDIDIGTNKITLNDVDEEDWATAWKKYYKPVSISDKITITPTWEDYKSKFPEEVVIELDPGMAFGTGTHPTTMLTLRAIEKHLKQGQTVIDVGTGSGILSIASALLGAGDVYAYDLDDIAVTSAKSNIELNRAASKVKVEQNNLLDDIEINPDLIVANILAEIIVKFERKAFSLLKPGGLFITSGIIESKENMVKQALESAGFDILEMNKQEDWVLIVAKKPS